MKACWEGPESEICSKLMASFKVPSESSCADEGGDW